MEEFSNSSLDYSLCLEILSRDIVATCGSVGHTFSEKLGQGWLVDSCYLSLEISELFPMFCNSTHSIFQVFPGYMWFYSYLEFHTSFKSRANTNNWMLNTAFRQEAPIWNYWINHLRNEIKKKLKVTFWRYFKEYSSFRKKKQLSIIQQMSLRCSYPNFFNWIDQMPFPLKMTKEISSVM